MTLKHTPGELGFKRDMLLPVPSKIDWKQILMCKQDVITQTNLRENKSRTDYNYQVEQRILILNKNPHKSKLEASVLNEGPWEIKKFHENGTVTIPRNNYHERMNICRIRPFFE